MKTQPQVYHSEPTIGPNFKVCLAIVAGVYFLWAALHPDHWRLIDGVNLVIHEAGHLIFRPLGEFMTVAGGSLFQVAVPTIFAGYFHFNKKYFSSALVLFWVGASMLNVSVYAADSVVMQLPLLGGDNSIHDWNYMLDRLNLLRSTGAIALAIRACGTLTIVFATIWALYTARRVANTH